MAGSGFGPAAVADPLDRRGPHERRARARIVFPERRTGFDRRQAEAPTRRLVDAALAELREDRFTLALLLVGTNVLNVLDYRATVHALARGNVEGNPVMAALFEVDYGVAAFVKLAVIAVASLVIWRSRRFRTVLLAAVLSFLVYAALFAYHLYGANLGYL